MIGSILENVLLSPIRPARMLLLAAVVLLTTPSAHGQVRQNPSPMVEHTRAHERIAPGERPGTRRMVDAGLPRPVSLYIPAHTGDAAPHPAESSLLIHFMGAEYIAEDAVAKTGFHDVLAVVNLGSGSSAFERPLQEAGAFEALLDSLAVAAADARGRPARFAHIDVSAFSAGYGAVRTILAARPERIHGVLLLDALHTGYVPEHTPAADGGKLDTTLLEPFVRFAKRSGSGETAFVLTHSEVFPGTFASTTETSEHLLDAVGLSREAVLKWGPAGMQQLSESRTGRFFVLGFAGNSAPDHMDHLHGMAEFLRLLHAPGRD